MTNLDKARELANEAWVGEDGQSQMIKAIGCLTATQMAEWKDQQFEEKIKEVFGGGIEICGTYWNTLELIRLLVK